MFLFYFSKLYMCHHTDYQRVSVEENKKGKSKNCSCLAKIKISIKHKTINTIKKDKCLKVILKVK